MEGYLGEIRLFSFKKVPRGWALCDGTLIQVATNQALFSLLGIAYGGDGRNTFALPDLRGRVPVHLSNTNPYYTLGTTSGIDAVLLDNTQLPLHTHAVCVDNNPATQPLPLNNIPAQPAKIAAADPNPPNLYANTAHVTTFDPSVIQTTGGSQAHENRQPFLAINYCICVSGLYPPRD
ncbi:Phage tail collar domain-containing protein [Azospirillaceae bacterium]|nr:hypothetical protein MTCCP1_00051 [uncultured bacterium]